MLIQFDVTAKDIADGIISNCDECPIALSISRTLGAHRKDVFFQLQVGTHSVMINSVKYYLPQTAQDFIYSLDTHKHVAPFTFEMELPFEPLSKTS